MSEADLKERRLTNPCSARPPWLAGTRTALDRAVVAAYCCGADGEDEESLRCLLSPNGKGTDPV